MLRARSAEPDLAEASARTQGRRELSDVPWVRELACQPGVEQVLTAGAVLKKSCARPEDHIVRLLARTSTANYPFVPGIRTYE